MIFVDEDERRGALRDLREHVDRDEACEPERGRLEETGDMFDSPREDVLRCLVA